MRSLRNDFFFEEAVKIISQGESVEIFVKGKSMAPYLKDEEDKIVLSPLQPTEPKKGDIVLFLHSEQYLLHRVIKIKENVFITQGDGVIKNQEEISLSNITGIVRFIIRPSGKCVSVNDLNHRIYWRCWLFFRPVRRYLLAVNNFFF